MDPSYEWAHLILGQAYEQKGEYNLALGELRKAVELSHNSPLMVSALAHAFAVSGNPGEAQKLLAQLISQAHKQYVSPYYIAIVYLGLGKKDLAITWLEKELADRSNGLVFAKVEPKIDPHRSSTCLIAIENKLIFPTLDYICSNRLTVSR